MVKIAIVQIHAEIQSHVNDYLYKGGPYFDPFQIP